VLGRRLRRGRKKGRAAPVSSARWHRGGVAPCLSSWPPEAGHPRLFFVLKAKSILQYAFSFVIVLRSSPIPGGRTQWMPAKH